MNEDTIMNKNKQILLVEDDKISQEIVLDLLAQSGYMIDIANNGKEAVEMAGTNNYHIILMDVQMPVMDGLEATKSIRKIPGKESIPIIAMTASNLDADRQLCLDAGMNGHMGKPVEPELLFSTIAKWLPGQNESISVGESNLMIDENDNEVKIFDSIPGLDFRHGLKIVKGKVPSYLNLLHTYTELHGNDMAVLLDFLKSNNREEARRVVHSIKSVLGSLGAMKLSKLCEELELAILSGSEIKDMENLLSTFGSTHQEFVDAINVIPVIDKKHEKKT